MNQVDLRVEKLIDLCCKLNSDEFPVITKLALDLQRCRGEFRLARDLGGGLKRDENYSIASLPDGLLEAYEEACKHFWRSGSYRKLKNSESAIGRHFIERLIEYWHSGNPKDIDIEDK